MRIAAKKPVLHQSWWVALFVTACLGLYFHAGYEKDQMHEDLTTRLVLLEKEKVRAMEEQQELLQQIQSQSDPAWVEMVLKRNLGMVSEGQVKVHFSQE